MESIYVKNISSTNFQGQTIEVYFAVNENQNVN
ncbi:hypothetical protein SAMN05444277_104234 [Parafilimonas terrae]|uniref:Uncharacterized protein n=1 Tax=Parafilimonas terrae TaxID=1465490 RepID=A0A1I5V6I6_9BACT|nr:hypothetical protein SAMN05444277_104234 [Parafilimonas terrae]